MANEITLAQAQAWAQNWNNDKLTFLERNDLKAFSISETIINSVLTPVGVVGMRAYLGIDENNEPHLMLVGIDANGNDIINPASGYNIYNFAKPCPSCCSTTTPKING